VSAWSDKVKDFVMGHPDASEVDPEPEQTDTPDVSDLPTDPGDAGAIPRDLEIKPGLDEVGDDDPATTQP
jgi:hypothetical protein